MNNNPPLTPVPALTSTHCLHHPSSCTLMNLQSQILTAITRISSLPSFRTSPYLSRSPLDKLVFPDLSGFTPLHYVAAAGDFELAQNLVYIFNQLGRPDFLMSLDRQGRSPFHWAVECGSVRIVKLLTENGVAINTQDFEGSAPIHRAIAAIHKAVLKDKKDECREILSYLASRVDVNIPDIGGVSALHLSAELGDLESIQVLIKYGAWINIKDHQGENVLFYAVRGGHVEVIKALVEDYNINMDMLNEDDESVLDLCKSIGDDSLTDLVASLFSSRLDKHKMGCLLNETNGIKWSGQKVEVMASHSGSIRFSGHSCA